MPDRLRLSELLEALSHALDLTEGQPDGHCARACWIGMRVGAALELSEDRLADLYYVLLLKDLGCSSNAARICQLYLTDDLGFKRAFKETSDTLPALLRFVVTQTGASAGLVERVRATLHILRHGGAVAHELIETRCTRGADIARRMRFSPAVADGIHSLDEHWDGRGKPDGLRGDAVPLSAQIALLAQVVDVFHTGAGPAGALAEVTARTGTWFGPDLVGAFRRAAAEPDFWPGLQSPDLPAAVLGSEPAGAVLHPDEDHLDDIALAFADVIDAKSPFTGGHSSRVALFCDLIAERQGVSAGGRRALRRGALLHDIGKLGVSSAILDKPGRLDEAEWDAMRRHAATGEAILSRIAPFGDLARLAGQHHERLDGAGYPRGLSGGAIGPDTRILTTADIFDALTADRPYRAAMPLGRALAVMRESVGTALDPDCFAALESGLLRLGPTVGPATRPEFDESRPIPAALLDHLAGQVQLVGAA